MQKKQQGTESAVLNMCHSVSTPSFFAPELLLHPSEHKEPMLFSVGSCAPQLVLHSCSSS